RRSEYAADQQRSKPIAGCAIVQRTRTVGFVGTAWRKQRAAGADSDGHPPASGSSRIAAADLDQYLRGAEYAFTGNEDPAATRKDQYARPIAYQNALPDADEYADPNQHTDANQHAYEHTDSYAYEYGYQHVHQYKYFDTL